MTFTSRLARIGRLAAAAIKGFFSLETKTTTPLFDPKRTTL
jgi:hypothetical protein